MPSDTHRVIQAVWRMESAKIIARLTRMVKDVGLAEEMAQDALVTALETWPEAGVPDNPGAWLMTTAKNRALDHLRHGRRADLKHEEIAREEDEKRATPDLERAIDEEVGDDLLRLVLVACHPVLPTDARVALTLRMLGGLTTDEIARAFLVPEPTIAQRIVRAKKTLADAQVPFEVPRGAALTERVSSVLEVLYLVFNEGYSATAGDDWMRPALCEDAMRLGRVLTHLVPDDPEVHALVALVELGASRTPARTGPTGEPILLLDQDRSRWDRVLLQRGLAALAKAEALGGVPGPYLMQAEIAACHARATTADETDWRRIAALYTVLAQVSPSPIVELNRAVAVSMAFGAAAALPIVDALQSEPALANYHLLPSVRADLLIRLGRLAEAKVELDRAASWTRNAREREMLEARAAACETGAARFERIREDPMGGKIRSRAAPLDARQEPGDFLGRLWKLFGPPSPADCGFEYHLRDRVTGLVFTAYSGASGPAYAGAPYDEAALAPVLDALDAVLDSTAPRDCEFTIPAGVRFGVRDGAAFEERV